MTVEIKESHHSDFFVKWDYNSTTHRYNLITRKIQTYLVIQDHKRVDSFENYENALKCVEKLKENLS